MKYWTFWKGPSLNAGPSGKFLIVDHPKEDHNERMFKHVRLRSESGTYWKSPVKKENYPYKWFTIKHNSINTRTSKNILWSNSSIQMCSTSKDWKTGYVMKTGPTEKFL